MLRRRGQPGTKLVPTCLGFRGDQGSGFPGFRVWRFGGASPLNSETLGVSVAFRVQGLGFRNPKP